MSQNTIRLIIWIVANAIILLLFFVLRRLYKKETQTREKNVRIYILTNNKLTAL